MAEKVLILGDSGTGKSTSLRNFTANEVYVISCAGKPLPFKNKFEMVKPSFSQLTLDVLAAMTDAANKGKKVLVVDDAQYIMSFQYMRRIKENGWDKWNDIQGDFFNILQFCDDLPDDMVVYFLSHLQRTDDGREKIKTMGKMLDEKITIEGLFTTVLKTAVTDGQYVFLTQNSGNDTVKSPLGMFDTYAIDNDLKYVDTKIRNYYELGESFASDAEVAKMDEEAAKPEVAKPDPDGKKRRKRKKRDENKEEEHQEAPAEETKEEAADEKPKRKRKRRKASSEEVEELVNGLTKEEIEAIEVPFDTEEPTTEKGE